MTMIGGGFWQLPGITATLETTENIIWWGNRQWQRLRPDAIDSAAVDAGASPTNLLRIGLVMGKITSSGKLTPWSPVATNGSQHIHGILVVDQNMFNNGVAADRWFGYCFVGGTLKAKSLLIAGASNSFGLSGHALEYHVRNLLTSTGRFQLDDELKGSTGEWSQYQFASLQADPAAITLTAADNNSLCIANHSALTAYVLPTAKVGLRFGFYSITNTGFSIAGATGDILIFYNDVDLDTITFSTTAKTIGTFLEASCIPTTTTSPYTPKWMVQNRSGVESTGLSTLPVVAD